MFMVAMWDANGDVMANYPSIDHNLGQLNESAMNRFANRRRPAGGLQFFKQTFDMRLHGSLGDPQLVPDVLVAFALGDQF